MAKQTLNSSGETHGTIRDKINAMFTELYASVLAAVDRANHTGTQLASTISDFATAADARISAAIGSSVQAFSATLTSWAAKTVPTGAVVGTTDTQVFTNKRITKRVLSITSSATPTINTDDYDAVNITALAAAITSFTTNLTGTPNNFDTLEIRIKDDGTARALSFGASFAAKGVSLPTTTVAGKHLNLVFKWHSLSSVWGLVGSAQEA